MIPVRSRSSAPSIASAALVAGLLASACSPKAAQLAFGGDSRDLRPRPPGAGQSSPTHPPVLVVAFDGVGRAILYDLLRCGMMPGLARLLGSGEGKAFPHAYFDERLLSTLPSSTMAAWVTTFTGVGPAQHGVTGNEFFIREERRFAAPAPGTFSDSTPVLAIYTDGYLNKLGFSPSVYERMRKEDPDVLIWVAMQHFWAGTDRLLLTKPTIVAEAFEAFVANTASKLTTGKDTRDVYEHLDTQVVDVVIGALDAKPLPDVLTVYLSGADLYAHIASEGPDVARRAYLTEVVDPQMTRLARKLEERQGLLDRFVVVTADHGHTEVLHDDTHALSASDKHGPAVALERAGFRVRPFKLDVDAKDDFQAVLAYEGAIAYAYMADRSSCPNKGDVCDWKKPPRFEEDVLPVADAFFRSSEEGAPVPELKGTLDMVLTRRPRPYAEDDLPFEVYVGKGQLVPVERYLEEHPHPTYIDMASRLRELAVGPHGERAGDVLLLAHNGDRADVAQRYYFAEPYHSWHGSPSREDSEIPLIVARQTATPETLRALVDHAVGEHPHQQKVTDLLLSIRRQPRGK